MTWIDGRYYVAEADQENGIIEFDIVDNTISNVNKLYYFGVTNKESLLRFYSLYT